MRFEDNFAAEPILFVPIGFLLSHIHFLKVVLYSIWHKMKEIKFQWVPKNTCLKYYMIFRYLPSEAGLQIFFKISGPK